MTSIDRNSIRCTPYTARTAGTCTGPTAMTSTCVGAPTARAAPRVSTRLWTPEVQPDRMADLPEPESSVNRETHRG
jgi:hypothetical protein